MSFMLIQTPNPLTLKEALPDFSRTTHIFLPINDCHNVEIPEGGSHWSLLLVSIIDGVSFHYDSLSSSNQSEADRASHQLGRLLGKPLRFINLSGSPQQGNSSDCGVFVCIQMRYLLLKRLLVADSQQKINMSMAGKSVNATAGRKEILRIIEGFRKEGEKRRSWAKPSLFPRYLFSISSERVELVRSKKLTTSRRSTSPHRNGKIPSRSPPRVDWTHHLNGSLFASGMIFFCSIAIYSNQLCCTLSVFALKRLKPVDGYWALPLRLFADMITVKFVCNGHRWTRPKSHCMRRRLRLRFEKLPSRYLSPHLNFFLLALLQPFSPIPEASFGQDSSGSL